MISIHYFIPQKPKLGKKHGTNHIAKNADGAVSRGSSPTTPRGRAQASHLSDLEASLCRGVTPHSPTPITGEGWCTLWISLLLRTPGINCMSTGAA